MGDNISNIKDKKIIPLRAENTKYTENELYFLPGDVEDILAAIPDYLFFKDTNSCYLGCNKRFAEFVGLEHPKDIVGLNDFDFPWQPPGYRAETFQSDDQNVLAGKPIINQTETIKMPNHPVHLMQVSKYPLRHSDGEIYGILGIARDMTSEIKTAAYLEDLLVQAERDNRSWQTLIANISHSLLMPLAGIIELGGSLQKRLIGTPNADIFASMKGSAEQLLQRIGGLVNFIDRYEGGRRIEKAEKCSPVTLLNNLKTLMSPVAQQKGLTLHIADEALPPALCFTHQTFLSITINLVSNAINFTDKGTVHIHCKFKENNLILTVKNTNISLTDSEKKRLSQSSNVKATYQNATSESGLELYLVKQALKDNGGTLSIAGADKSDSCFTVHYPALQ